MRRKEDPPLIAGRGNYVDDITLPGMLWAAFVRSPEAHATIASIDTSAAVARDGVEAVFTGADLDLEAPLPLAWVPPGVEVSRAAALAARQGRGQARRRPGRRGHRHATATRWSTPPRT